MERMHIEAMGPDEGAPGLFPAPRTAPVRSRHRPEPTPAQRAIGLLSRREHSRRELNRKLQARGVERGDAEQAIERLSQAGWQDDARFADTLARTRMHAGYGPLRIRAELATHGLDADVVRAALDAVEAHVDWRQSALELVERRFGSLAGVDPRQRRRAADLLIRRGFDADTVRHATRVGTDD